MLGDCAAFGAAVAVVGYLQAGRHLRSWLPIFVYACLVTGIAAAALTAGGLVFEGGVLVGAERQGVLGWMASARYAPWVVYLAVGPGLVGHTGKVVKVLGQAHGAVLRAGQGALPTKCAKCALSATHSHHARQMRALTALHGLRWTTAVLHHQAVPCFSRPCDRLPSRCSHPMPRCRPCPQASTHC